MHYVYTMNNTTNTTAAKHREKSVSENEFDRISQKFPGVQVRKFQASGLKETFLVKWLDGEKAPYDLVYLFRANFG